MLLKLLRYILKILARAVVAKYRPRIVGITGSVGKTTTKEAIMVVLAKKYRVRGNIKNYNNEIGLPLTILGLESPGRSWKGWLAVIVSSFRLLSRRDLDYPEFVVLEMGVDRPGDLDYLLSIVQPTIGVVTTIGQAHLEFFGSQDNIAKEKSKLIASLPSGGYGILNADDHRTIAMAKDGRAEIMTYGLGSEAEVRATDISFKYQPSGQLTANSLLGLAFKINYGGSVVPMIMPAIISEAVVYSALAATTVGLAEGINLLDIADALRDFCPPKGRLNILPGSQSRILLDDSYNASPTSVAAALDILNRLPIDAGVKRVAVLGDMLELGIDGPAEHRRIGQMVAKLAIDQLVLVGSLARQIGEEAERKGWSGRIDNFNKTVDAVEKINEIVPAPAIVLLKGSQGARIEKIVKELLADKTKAAELLVRQDDHWLLNS